MADELHRLSDHGVALDVNFSKYGYDAHIREFLEEIQLQSIDWLCAFQGPENRIPHPVRSARDAHPPARSAIGMPS